MNSFEDITDGHNEVQEEEIVLPSDPIQSTQEGQGGGDVKWKSVSLKAWLKASSEHNDRNNNVSRPASEVSDLDTGILVDGSGVENPLEKSESGCYISRGKLRKISTGSSVSPRSVDKSNVPPTPAVRKISSGSNSNQTMENNTQNTRAQALSKQQSNLSIDTKNLPAACTRFNRKNYPQSPTSPKSAQTINPVPTQCTSPRSKILEKRKMSSPPQLRRRSTSAKMNYINGTMRPISGYGKLNKMSLQELKTKKNSESNKKDAESKSDPVGKKSGFSSILGLMTFKRNMNKRRRQKIASTRHLSTLAEGLDCLDEEDDDDGDEFHR